MSTPLPPHTPEGWDQVVAAIETAVSAHGLPYVSYREGRQAHVTLDGNFTRQDLERLAAAMKQAEDWENSA